jgi:hypothetical protein
MVILAVLGLFFSGLGCFRCYGFFYGMRVQRARSTAAAKSKQATGLCVYSSELSWGQTKTQATKTTFNKPTQDGEQCGRAAAQQVSAHQHGLQVRLFLKGLGESGRACGWRSIHR